MRLDAHDITRRAREAHGPDGRLPRSREPARSGEAGPEDCWTCKAPDEHVVPRGRRI